MPLNIIGKKPIETVIGKTTEVSLLASGDGTEVIHHKLKSGARWMLTPEEGWEALEYFMVLSGRLIYKSESNGDTILNPGDSVSASPIDDDALFIAEIETEFLYVSSRPVFHHYSKEIVSLINLAVEIEEKDGYTSDHCQRINDLAMLISEKLGLQVYDIYLLNLASYFHDIGKIKVPLDILNKPGKLTNEEFEIMKLHTVWGREVLESTKNPDLMKVGKIVEQHHERWDGKGYPLALNGEEISILAAIIAVVDSFDAMTTDRVYQKGRSKEEAVQEIIRCSGTMYHPKVVEAFVSISNKI